MRAIILNPTGLGVRNDGQGNGNFGSPRGKRRHDGVDFICIPGERVRWPISGLFTRMSRPYADDPHYTGAYVIGQRVSIKLWYFEPYPELVGQQVQQGDFAGIAQDVSMKYNDPEQPPMTPHVHLQVVVIDPTLLM